VSLIRKNFIYNNLFGLTNVLIPIIIFPYVSRILGVSGVGIVSFAISLTATFVIIGSLGIPVYGIREIAKVKKDKDQLSAVFSEILVIQFFWLLFTLVLYAVWLFFTATFIDETIIKYVSFVHIAGLIGMLNWFFQGIENYRFITVINAVLKLVTLVLVFALVTYPEDYWMYYTILVVSTVLGAVVSVAYSLSFVNLRFKNLALKRHIKPISILFGTQLAIGIYINLDIIFLKYFSSDEQVGLYTPASKLVKLCLLFVTSLGTVLIPKIAMFIKEGKIEESKNIISKSIQFVLLLSLPIMVVLGMLSSEIIELFAGTAFAFSAVLMRLLVPLIFLIGMSTVFGLQILVPFHKEKKLLIAVTIGAVISVVLNVVLIPKFASKGAAYAILITELAITLFTFYYAKKTISFTYPYKKALHYLLLSVLLIPIALFFKEFFRGITYVLSVSISSFLFYIFGLILIKDTFFNTYFLQPILNFRK